MSTYSMNSKSQQGAILLVALIMLLLVTIIGIASMRDTSLQERMAGNLRDQELALQAAEAALRKGEEKAEELLGKELDSLIGTPISADYAGFPDVAKEPSYTISYLASRQPGLGTPISGGVVRVEAYGYGRSQDAANKPSVEIKLFSIFMAFDD